MAFDGTEWRHSRPDDNDLANEIDDFMRDDKIAVQSRMNLEHGWGTAQTATNQAGWHKFITFSGQTAAPLLTAYGTVTTQLASIWCSSGSGALNISDSAGNTYLLMKSGAGVAFFGGTGAIGDLPYVTSGGGFAALAAGSSGYALTAQGTTAAPTWSAIGALAGTWSSGVAVGSATQVTKDTFVVSIFETTVTTKTTATLKTDGNATPTTIRGQCNFDFNNNLGKDTLSCMVKKNDYYLVETSGGSITVTTYVIPIGA